MSHSNDRNPTDPSALATIVRALFAVEKVRLELPVGNYAATVLLEGAGKCLSIDLLRALLDQGCLTPLEYDGAFLEDSHDGAGVVNVRVPAWGWLQVREDGNVEGIEE